MKIGSPNILWNEIQRGVLHGSVFGPLLFNVFVNDIFVFIEKSEICNFADDKYHLWLCAKGSFREYKLRCEDLIINMHGLE